MITKLWHKLVLMFNFDYHLCAPTPTSDDYLRRKLPSIINNFNDDLHVTNQVLNCDKLRRNHL
uniref:Uncharacterized protein n=1 Tax=Cucumis melo TaxID=3656 RepID=A0A9I9ECS8_CUCME